MGSIGASVSFSLVTNAGNSPVSRVIGWEANLPGWSCFVYKAGALGRAGVLLPAPVGDGGCRAKRISEWRRLERQNPGINMGLP